MIATRDDGRLRSLIRDTRIAGIARRVLLLRLSALPEPSSRQYRAAQEALDPLFGANRAQLFALPGGDLAMVWRGEAEAALQRSLEALGRVFQGVADPEGMAVMLRLPEDAGLLLGELATAAPVAAPAAALRALQPGALDALEAALPQMSIDRFVRRQQVSEAWNGGFRPAWERRFLAIGELFETLVPGCSAAADPWLLRRLGRSLDRRLLAWLGGELRGSGPFGIELNVASILGPEFLKLDSQMTAGLRGQVVLGLRPADIVADLEEFRFARDFARARGYRMMLRASAAHLEVIDVAELGLDLVHLRWSEALLGLGPELPAGLVLGGADRLAAIDWGRRHQVRYFQGGLAR